MIWSRRCSLRKLKFDKSYSKIDCYEGYYTFNNEANYNLGAERDKVIHSNKIKGKSI